MRIAKKYLLFSGLGRKKVGLTRVRIAKKIHSSLLRQQGHQPCLRRVISPAFAGSSAAGFDLIFS